MPVEIKDPIEDNLQDKSTAVDIKENQYLSKDYSDSEEQLRRDKLKHLKADNKLMHNIRYWAFVILAFIDA